MLREAAWPHQALNKGWSQSAKYLFSQYFHNKNPLSERSCLAGGAVIHASDLMLGILPPARLTDIDIFVLCASKISKDALEVARRAGFPKRRTRNGTEFKQAICEPCECDEKRLALHTCEIADLYCQCGCASEWSRLMLWFKQEFPDCIFAPYKTAAVMNIYIPGEEVHFQVILERVATPAQLLGSFDLDVVRCAINHRGHLIYSPYQRVAQESRVVNLVTGSPDTHRLRKYRAKGFRVARVSEELEDPPDVEERYKEKRLGLYGSTPVHTIEDLRHCTGYNVVTSDVAVAGGRVLYGGTAKYGGESAAWHEYDSPVRLLGDRRVKSFHRELPSDRVHPVVQLPEVPGAPRRVVHFAVLSGMCISGTVLAVSDSQIRMLLFRPATEELWRNIVAALRTIPLRDPVESMEHYFAGGVLKLLFMVKEGLTSKLRTAMMSGEMVDLEFTLVPVGGGVGGNRGLVMVARKCVQTVGEPEKYIEVSTNWRGMVQNEEKEEEKEESIASRLQRRRRRRKKKRRVQQRDEGQSPLKRQKKENGSTCVHALQSELPKCVANIVEKYAQEVWIPPNGKEGTLIVKLVLSTYVRGVWDLEDAHRRWRDGMRYLGEVACCEGVPEWFRSKLLCELQSLRGKNPSAAFSVQPEDEEHKISDD